MTRSPLTRATLGRVLYVPATLVALLVGCSPDVAPGGDSLTTAAQSTTPATTSRAILLDPAHPAWSNRAPDTTHVRFETTKGNFLVELIRPWAPIGVDRFYNLIQHGYYDDVRFHRTVPDFITQWGVSGDPEVNTVWYERGLPDDPVVASNVRGTIAFAFTEPGTRTTQVYISMVDNSRLDEQGFAPIGRVIDGMDSVVDSIFSGYGETSGGGVRRGDQSRLVAEGNAYLDEAFPRLDRLIRATIVNR